MNLFRKFRKRKYLDLTYKKPDVRGIIKKNRKLRKKRIFNSSL